MTVSLLIISLSLTLQILSALVALRLIFSGKRATGAFMLLLTLLMTFRRFISFYREVAGDTVKTDLPAEITALVVSCILLLGFAYIVRLISAHKGELEERTRTEAALEETNAKLHALIQSMPDMVVFKDVEGKHLLVNRVVENITGHKKEDFLGKTIEALLPPEAAEFCRKSDHEALRSTTSVHFEEQIPGMGGETRYLDTIKAPIFDDNRKIVGLVAVSRDITARKHQEEEIRESEERFRGAFENASVGASIVDFSGRFVKVNKRLCDMLSYPEKELLSKTFSDISHQDDIMKGLDALGKLISGETDYLSIEKRYIRGDGHIINAVVSPSAIRDENGKPIYCLGMWQDITERRRAENALSESEEKFRSIFDKAKDGILIASAATRKFFEANKMMCDMLGYTREEITNLSVDDIHPREDLPLVREDFAKRIRGEKAAETIPVLRKDGRIFYADIGANLITLDGERYLIGIFRDITERKRAEEMLHKTNQTLSSLIRYSPLAIINTGLDGRVTVWNPAAERLFGWPEEEVLGRENPIVPADKRQEYNRLREGVRQGSPYLSRELLRQKKDGSLIYVNASSAAIFDSDGRPVALYAIFEDITRRKRMEEEFKRLGSQNELILNSAGEGIYGLDRDGNITFINPAAAKMVGWTVAELIGRRSHETFHHTRPDGSSYPREECAFHKALMSGAVHQVKDEVFWRKDGTSFPIEYVSTPMRENGTVVGAVVVFKDITDHKQAEKTLKAAVISAGEEKAKSEAVIAAIGDNLVILDPEFRIIYQNEVDRKMIGDLVGKCCYKAFEGRDTVCENCPVEMSFQDGLVHRGERIASTNIGIMHLDITASPLRDAAGKVVAVIEMVRDITSRKQAEEAIRKSRDELEKQVTERTAELTMMNEQLRNFSSYLQQAREKERAAIAREIHDELGQAMTALKMDFAWLKKKIPPDRKDLVEKEASMSELIETTMESVKRIATELRPGMLDHLGLASAVEWQAEEFERRTGIKCNIVFRPEEIVLDRDRSTAVFRVFQETLTNIARHAKATKITIGLTRGPDEFMLRVKDNGKGITEKQISDPTSLGLIGIRERVHAWGGKVAIKSSRQSGTSITVRIPLTH